MRETDEFYSRNPLSVECDMHVATGAGGLACDIKRATPLRDVAHKEMAQPRKAIRNFELLRRSLRRRRETAGQRSGLLGRFLRSRSGVTMVEFALVGPLFLLLTFAIVDNGLVLFTQTVLDNATREAARQIRIGQVQITGDTDGTGLFKTTLCRNLGGFIPCASVTWRVQSVNSAGLFSSLSSAVTANSSGVMQNTGFAPGTPQSFVLVQVGYTQPYIMPFLNKIAGATGNLLLVSTVAFQNEHYQ